MAQAVFLQRAHQTEAILYECYIHAQGSLTGIEIIWNTHHFYTSRELYFDRDKTDVMNVIVSCG